jgi:hypothetical protein
MASFILRHVRFSSATPRFQNVSFSDDAPIAFHSTAYAAKMCMKENIVVVSVISSTYVNGNVVYGDVCLLVGDEVSFGAGYVLSDGTYNPRVYRLVDANSVVPKGVVDTLEIDRKHHASIRSTLACVMCSNPLLLPHIMACGHTACGDCLADTFAERAPHERACPMCGFCVGLAKQDPVLDVCMSSLIGELVEPYMSADALAEREERKEVWRNRKTFLTKHSPTSTPPSVTDMIATAFKLPNI